MEINPAYRRIQLLLLLVQVPTPGKRGTKSISTRTLSQQNTVKVGWTLPRASWARGIGHFCFSTGSFGSTRFFLHSQDGAAQARTPHLGRVIAQVCLGHLPSLSPLIPHPQPPQHEQGLRHFPSHLPNSLAPGKPQSNECGESQVCSLIVVVLWRSQDEVRAENWL